MQRNTFRKMQFSFVSRLLLSVFYFLLFTLHFSLLFPTMVYAQGIEAPPVTSFKPDTALPKVNVPEFVITGKAQAELPTPEKQSIEIDSSYFQGQSLQGIGIKVPVNSLTELDIEPGNVPNLFARLSLGTYTTTNYLVSGSDELSGYNFHGSLSGNYTSGFVPYTIRRHFSIQAGAEKDYEVGDGTMATNSLDAGYSHRSYFLYGGPQPDGIRTTDHVTAGVVSDFSSGELPLSAKIGFERFSMDDVWLGVQSILKLQFTTQVDLSSGSVGIDGAFRFGNHSISYETLGGILSDSVNDPFYNLTLGANYNNVSGNLTYSLGLRYFQYEDDSSNGIAKLYPDLRAWYKVNDVLDLFTKFHGTIGEPELYEFIAIDHYVNGILPMMDTQDYADFVLGVRVAATNELTIVPQISVEGARYYPLFVSDSLNNNFLHYANRVTVFTASIGADYKMDQFSAGVVVNLRTGTADSLNSIPNLPPFDLNTNASYYVTPQFIASGSLLVLSTRYSDIDLTRKVNASWLLGLRLSYDVTAGEIPLEIFAEAKNLLNQKYYIWQGYREFPLTISIGVSSKIL